MTLVIILVTATMVLIGVALVIRGITDLYGKHYGAIGIAFLLVAGWGVFCYYAKEEQVPPVEYIEKSDDEDVVIV